MKTDVDFFLFSVTPSMDRDSFQNKTTPTLVASLLTLPTWFLHRAT